MSKIREPKLHSVSRVINDIIENYAYDTEIKGLISKPEVKEKLLEFETEFFEAMKNPEEEKILPQSYENFLTEIEENNENEKLTKEFGITKEHMTSLFSTRFDRLTYSPYYKSDVGCTICDSPLGVQLDHYLPKSKFYHFIITPVNLIPMCPSCNQNKKTVNTNIKINAPFHPYFEDFDFKEYVELDVQLEDDIILDIKVKEINEEPYIRYKKNYEIFELNVAYNVLASTALNNFIESLIENEKIEGTELNEVSVKDELELLYRATKSLRARKFNEIFVSFLTYKTILENDDPNVYKKIVEICEMRKEERTKEDVDFQLMDH